MELEYIVVQAGGKGTRLEYLTANKPKALVPVENLPMLFHLFRQYPDKRFIIIADYQKEVLRKYLECFAKVKYQVVDAIGTGTCSGVKGAIELLPKGKPFMLVWSDLILPQSLKLPEVTEDYIGISETFPCRWSYCEKEFKEEPSKEFGVAGFWLFTDKSKLDEVPQSGELVRWMQSKEMTFKTIGLSGTREFGILEEYKKLEKEKSRPFNKITVCGDTVIKEGIDEQGRQLAVRECMWYERVKEKQISVLPEIYGINPLKMERINGKNIYEYQIPYEDKKQILQKLVDELKTLHSVDSVETDSFSMHEAYYSKTMQRLSVIRDLVPFANEPEITINGRKCRNVFYHKRELEELVGQLKCEKFCIIHGDCTFSNLMLREDETPVLIDPRGYFGYTELYGDPMYDWAKLYYSIVGNYDKFNLKDFRMTINESDVELVVESNQWEDMEKDFFEMTQADEKSIKLIHAIIWLSLTTYAWQDYDSICGAFFYGLYYLEEVL